MALSLMTFAGASAQKRDVTVWPGAQGIHLRGEHELYLTSSPDRAITCHVKAISADVVVCREQTYPRSSVAAILKPHGSVSRAGKIYFATMLALFGGGAAACLLFIPSTPVAITIGAVLSLIAFISPIGLMGDNPDPPTLVYWQPGTTAGARVLASQLPRTASNTAQSSR
jgi:hypothetical protein